MPRLYITEKKKKNCWKNQWYLWHHIRKCNPKVSFHFNNFAIIGILCRSLLLVEESIVPWENHQLATNHKQTLSLKSCIKRCLDTDRNQSHNIIILTKINVNNFYIAWKKIIKYNKTEDFCLITATNKIKLPTLIKSFSFNSISINSIYMIFYFANLIIAILQTSFTTTKNLLAFIFMSANFPSQFQFWLSSLTSIV